MTRRRSSPLLRQLNQIRTWAHQGRTDTWIAHKLETSVETVAEFRAEHGLGRRVGGGGATAAPVTPERVAETAELEGPVEPTAGVAAADETASPRRRTRRRRAAEAEAPVAPPSTTPAAVEAPVEEPPPRRRRRARGEAPPPEVAAPVEEPVEAAPAPAPTPAPTPARRGRRARGEAEGEPEAAAPRPGGSLTRAVTVELDPDVLDDPLFREHWLVPGPLEVEVRADAIVLRRRDG